MQYVLSAGTDFRIICIFLAPSKKIKTKSHVSLNLALSIRWI